MRRVLVALWVVLEGGLASAESPPAVRLLYTRGPGAEACPEQAAVRDAVAARIGYVPFDERAARLVIVAVASASPTLHARIELGVPTGTIVGLRELSSTSRDCKELAAAVELALSIAIDPLSFTRPAGARPPPSSRAHLRAEAQGSAPRSEVRATASPPVEERPRLQIAASVGGVLAIGSAPSVAGGIALQGRLQWRWASIALEGRVDLPAYLDVAGGRVSTSLLLASVLGCGHYRWLFGCLEVGAGAMRAAGHGIPDAESVTLAYAAGGVRLGTELPLHRLFALRLHGDLLAVFTRATLRETSTRAEIWSTPAVSGAFGMAAVGRFR